MQKLIAFIHKLVLVFNKRTIRTVVQLVVGFAIGAPIVLGLLPADQATSAQIAEILAVCAGITRAWNLLEDRGLIPAWLKDDDPQGVVRIPRAAVAELKELHTKVDALVTAQREARPESRSAWLARNNAQVTASVNDNFSGPMARAAEAAEELGAKLDNDDIRRGDV